MALRGLGARHCWALQKGTWSPNTPIGGRRQIHQVVEAKPIKKLDGATAKKFLQEVIYRFGYPHSIITDNSTNFAEGAMAAFCC